MGISISTDDNKSAESSGIMSETVFLSISEKGKNVMSFSSELLSESDMVSG